MGARRKIFQDDNTRAKIQASLIINRLSDHVNGTVELSQTQVSAAKVLLNKVLPDLQSVEGHVNVDHTVKKVERLIVKPDDKPKLVHAIND